MRKIYRLIFLHFDGANVEYNIPKVALREREILWKKKKKKKKEQLAIIYFKKNYEARLSFHLVREH